MELLLLMKRFHFSEDEEREVLIVFLEPMSRDRSAFLAAAGAWADVDCESLKREIYESRAVSTRKPVEL